MSFYQSTNQLLKCGESSERLQSMPGSRGNVCFSQSISEEPDKPISKSVSCERVVQIGLKTKSCLSSQKAEKIHLRARLNETPPNDTATQSLSLAPAKQGMKNLIILGTCFMLVFTAFMSLKNVQSTLNEEEGIGMISLCVLYAASVVSCFLSPWIIHKLGTKGTICVTFAMLLIYTGANFYPKNSVLIISSIVLGLLKGPLWSAQSTYLTTLAYNYAAVTAQVNDLVINRFNGIFSAIFETSQIWGNLVTSFLFSANNHTLNSNPLNETTARRVCGAKDCEHHNVITTILKSSSFAVIPAELEYLLLGILCACVFGGLLLSIVFLERVSPISESKPTIQTSKQFLLSSFMLMKNLNLLLLIPIVFFIGLQRGFLLGDFTRSYVNCSLGVHHLGFTMACFGTTSAITSITISHIGQHIKRFVMMSAGAMFHLGLLAVLSLWTPDGNDVPMFYVTTGCLGLCDAIWQTQSNRLFGLLFKENQEAAFANYRMFHASGHALAFGYSHFLCVDVKVYILGGVLITSLVFYALLEVKMRKVLSQTNDTVVGKVVNV